MSKLQEVLPLEFFRVKQPYSTYLRIQFRKNFSLDQSDDNSWSEIIFDGKNRFFQNMNIEDSGGFPKVNLSLVDTNFSELESIIINSIVGLNVVNSTYRERDIGQLNESQNELRTEDYVRTFLDDTSYPNLRIKFGYNENILRTDLEESQIPTSYSQFETRNGSKTIYQSPWMYLKILDAKFQITEIGMAAEISAISMITNVLERAKIWRRNAYLVGRPKELLEQLRDWINGQIGAEGGRFIFTFEDDPVFFEAADVESEQEEEQEPLGLIDIALGGEESTVTTTNPDGTRTERRIASFRTLGSLLTEICGNVLPKSFRADGSPFTAEEYRTAGQREDQENNEEQSIAQRTVRYSYYYKKNDNNEHEIVFYYQDPQRSADEQGFIRNYVWRGGSKSIVKSFSIDSQLDFALINMPIFSFASSTPNAYQMGVVAGSQSSAGVINIGTEDVINAANNLEQGISFFSSITDSDEHTNNSESLGRTIANRVANNLSNGMFSGTIEIPGDPFYLFDSIVKPFQYLIRINVFRPEFEQNEKNVLTNKKSYLSGNYFVKKIVHSIGQDGFNTTLEISKFPDPDNDRDLLQVIVD